MTIKTEIGDLSALEPGPGKTFVLSLPVDMEEPSDAGLEHIRQKLKPLLNGAELIIVPSGAKLEEKKRGREFI